jgi:hypothetical protein
MGTLSEQDKIELLVDAGSVERQQEFEKMNRRAATLSPVEWLDFLNQAAKLSHKTNHVSARITGNKFLL